MKWTKPLLKRCGEPSWCEAACCADGAYLEYGDLAKIAAAMSEQPEMFTHVKVVVVPEADGPGFKTATVPHSYERNPGIPQTRCAFAYEDGRCALQAAAEASGLHRWKWKPRACWLFPLYEDEHYVLHPPPASEAEEAEVIPDYARADGAFYSIVPCGAHRSDGQPWAEVLDEELSRAALDKLTEWAKAVAGDDGVRIKPSGVHGIGVFATRDMEAGTRLFVSKRRVLDVIPVALSALIELVPDRAKRQLILDVSYRDGGVVMVEPVMPSKYDASYFMNAAPSGWRANVAWGSSDSEEWAEVVRSVSAGDELWLGDYDPAGDSE